MVEREAGNYDALPATAAKKQIPIFQYRIFKSPSLKWKIKNIAKHL